MWCEIEGRNVNVLESELSAPKAKYMSLTTFASMRCVYELKDIKSG